MKRKFISRKGRVSTHALRRKIHLKNTHKKIINRRKAFASAVMEELG